MIGAIAQLAAASSLTSGNADYAPLRQILTGSVYSHIDGHAFRINAAAYAGTAAQTPTLFHGHLKNTHATVLPVGGRFSFQRRRQS